MESGQAILDREANLALTEEVGMSKQTKPICPHSVQLVGYSNLERLANYWNDTEKDSVYFNFAKFNVENFKEKLTGHFMKPENRSKVVVMDCLTRDWLVGANDDDKVSLVNGHYNKPVTMKTDSMINEKVGLLSQVVACISKVYTDLDLSPPLILLLSPLEKHNCCPKHCGDLDEGTLNSMIKLLPVYLEKIADLPEYVKVLNIKNVTEKAWICKSTVDGVHWNQDIKAKVSHAIYTIASEFSNKVTPLSYVYNGRRIVNADTKFTGFVAEVCEKLGKSRMQKRPGSSEEDLEQQAFEMEDAELAKQRSKGKHSATTRANFISKANRSESGGRKYQNERKKGEQTSQKQRNEYGFQYRKRERSPGSSYNFTHTPAQDSRFARGEKRVRKN